MIIFYTWCWYYHLSSRQKNPKNPVLGDFHLIPPDRSSRAVALPLRGCKPACCRYATAAHAAHAAHGLCTCPLESSSLRAASRSCFAAAAAAGLPGSSLRSPARSIRGGLPARGLGTLRSGPRNFATLSLRVPASRSVPSQIAQNLANARPLRRSDALWALRMPSSMLSCCTALLQLSAPERIAGQFAALTNPVNSLWLTGAATAMRRFVTRNFATLSLRATAAHPRGALNRPILRYAQQWGRFGATGAPY